MRRRIRWIRTGKWAGLSFVALILGISLLTIRWYVAHRPQSRYPVTVWWIASGQIGLRHLVSNDPNLKATDPRLPGGWTVADRAEPMGWWFVWKRQYMAGMFVTTIEIPLWAVFSVVGVPTALLWRLDRRRPLVACVNCGYSLLGLPPGAACPECGKAAQS